MERRHWDGEGEKCTLKRRGHLAVKEAISRIDT